MRAYDPSTRVRVPINCGTRVEDEISFLGLAKLAAPYATFDVRRRWRRSLEKLRAEVERTPAST
jgi:hypothetical protein